MATELEQINDGDWGNWKEAFGYAGEPGTCAISYQGGPDVASLDDAPATTFSRADVEHVEKLSEGEHDEKDWLVVGRLKDGRWFFLSAGCDYTGWD